MSDKDLLAKTTNELESLDKTAKDVIQYSEDDRRKADELFDYYQALISAGDNKGETREGLSKALKLREESVKNLVEILKIKARIIERKIMFDGSGTDSPSGMRKASGTDNSDLINEMEER